MVDDQTTKSSEEPQKALDRSPLIQAWRTTPDAFEPSMRRLLDRDELSSEALEGLLAEAGEDREDVHRSIQRIAADRTGHATDLSGNTFLTRSTLFVIPVSGRLSEIESYLEEEDGRRKLEEAVASSCAAGPVANVRIAPFSFGTEVPFLADPCLVHRILRAFRHPDGGCARARPPLASRCVRW